MCPQCLTIEGLKAPVSRVAWEGRWSEQRKCTFQLNLDFSQDCSLYEMTIMLSQVLRSSYLLLYALKWAFLKPMFCFVGVFVMKFFEVIIQSDNILCILWHFFAIETLSALNTDHRWASDLLNQRWKRYFSALYQKLLVQKTSVKT